tara:strand:+ start:323 stop:1264 length:942 start_codon:yes stop_codon:yes gene_type:complete
MGHLINIAYQGGTHGNFLRYCIDRYSELTDPISELPFTINTSHKRLNYSKLITQYHPNIKEPYFKNTDEPHILITVNKNDLLFIERWVTIRASNFNINTNNNKIQLTPKFLKVFLYEEKIKQYFNINLKEVNYIVPRFVMRDLYKMTFLDPNKNGFITTNKSLLTHNPKNCFNFPVNTFWDTNKFLDTLENANQKFNLKLKMDDSIVDLHKTFLEKLDFLTTKNRVFEIINAIKQHKELDISNIDTVEQAFISSWIEKNYKFIQIPMCNQFFKSTTEIMDYLKYYPEHYKAMNPNLPKFNGIPNPFYLWNLKK